MRQPVPGAEDALCDVNLPALIFLNMMSIFQDASVASTVYIHVRIKQFLSELLVLKRKFMKQMRANAK